MAPGHENDVHIDQDEDGEAGEEFIDPNDVLVEVAEGDIPMDEDEDEMGGEGHPDEEIVWEDNSMQHFPNHNGSVFAVSTHPTAPLAASGGEDDLGYIWDITTGDELVKLTGHTDSVTSTAFSADGELISTGGMDGKVRIWRRVGKEDYTKWEFLTELSGPDEVMVSSAVSHRSLSRSSRRPGQWLRWHPKGTVLLAGSNDTTVWLWQRESKNHTPTTASVLSITQYHPATPCRSSQVTLVRLPVVISLRMGSASSPRTQKGL